MLSLLAKVLKFNMATKARLDLNLAEGQGMFTDYVLEPFPPLAVSICFYRPFAFRSVNYLQLISRRLILYPW